MESLQRAVVLAQHLGGDAVRLGDQAQKQMLCACIVLFAVFGSALGKPDRLLRVWGIVFSHIEC